MAVSNWSCARIQTTKMIRSTGRVMGNITSSGTCKRELRRNSANCPGSRGVFGLLHDSQDKDQHFLFEGPLRLALFDLHLNSTDDDTVFALDLTGPRLVRLSPNWATPIPLPGEAAFLTFTENRYIPHLWHKKTANCSYMEHWNEKLKRFVMRAKNPQRFVTARGCIASTKIRTSSRSARAQIEPP
jgi:hypothetical protein